MLDLFHWLGTTAIGVAMRDSTWGFAITETIHLVALAILGGSVFVISATSLGWLFRDARIYVARALFPILIGALVVMVVSGGLLVSSKPVRYYVDPTFRTKMALLASSIVVSVLLHRLIDRADRTAAVKSLAALSLVSWLAVGVCGRLIGFL